MKLQKRNDQLLILVDGMNLFHRVFHSYSNLTNSSGFPTGALFGYLSALTYLTDEFSSNQIIIFWESGKNWRNKEDDNYKSRASTESQFSDEDKQKFSMSISSVNKTLLAIGILQIMKFPHEADDLIYYITNQYNKDVVIVSNDKDFLQLVNDERNISVARPKSGGGYDLYKEWEVYEKYEVKPSQMANYLALVGDVSDNVKGVVGIGPVKATKMIKDGLITKNKIKDTLTGEQLKQFIHSLKLVKMKQVLDEKIVFTSDDCIALIRNYDVDGVNEILSEYEFKKFTSIELKKLFNRRFKISFIKKVLL